MRKVRAGQQDGRHAPCTFPLSPLSSPGGGFPPATPSGGRQGPRQGIPLLQPCHGPCIFPFRAQARASPVLSAAPGPAPPLLILARCFISGPQVLGFPVRFVQCARSTDLLGRRLSLQSPGSRRGVAPYRLGAPPAAPFSPALPRGCHRPSGPGCAPPLRPLGIRARPPRRGSLPASGAGLTTAARRQARPSGILYFSVARGPADRTAFGLPVLGRCGRLRDRKKTRTLHSAASVWCSGLFNPLPAPGATSLRSDAPGRVLLRSRLRDRIKTRTLRSPARWWPAYRLSPPSSETGGCGRSVSFRSS